MPSCVAGHYIWHDEAGDRTVTREAYAAEIAKIRQERADIRVVVYDHSFEGDRAWFRFAFEWTDPKTGEPRSSRRHAILPNRGRQACRDMTFNAAARLGMERHRRTGALDERAPNQVRRSAMAKTPKRSVAFHWSRASAEGSASGRTPSLLYD